ncbi:MAG: ATP-dependent DNA ligase [Cyanobacteria bacterium P01_A01_bin.37]
MQRFTQLFQDVDATTSTNAKVQALQSYFQDEKPENAVWALYLLLGKTRRRTVTSTVLRNVFLNISDIPEWLFKECYAHVGDSAEVIALLLRDVKLEGESASDIALHQWLEKIIPTVKEAETDEDIQALVVSWWASLDSTEIFVLNKILAGAFRVGVSSKLVIKGLSAASGISEAVLAHRLMGDFDPTVEFFEQLVSKDGVEASPSQPYPFFLASPLEEEKFSRETMAEWQSEWKWDGIRAQIIKRQGELFIWSRGEDLITHQFPEFEEFFLTLSDGCVFDGEIVCWDQASDRPMPFNVLQKRLGRKRVTKKLMTESPVHFIAYDLLEHDGQDIREKPLGDRRQTMKAILQPLTAPPQDKQPKDRQLDSLPHSTNQGKQPFSPAPSCHSSTIPVANSEGRVSIAQVLEFETFRDLQVLREQSREHGAEGLVMKARNSPYLVGRKRGYWWKYKVEPMALDAVLIYAQAGSGKRANLFTDYTFALWKGEDDEKELISFAKAYSGLDNKEIEELDKWIRRNTIERFGPVRSVKPTYIFEIGFEGIAESSRHKSGIAVRFPRILRWRKDKPVEEADTLQTAMELLKNYA